jgi:decaprenylphospho-beta-D-ribofuranose 2-oxidase
VPTVREQVNYSGTMRFEAVTVFPTTVEELRFELQSARKRGLKVTLQGGALSYGDSAMPSQGSIVVNLTQMNRILGFDWDAGTVRVEPGVQLGEILVHSLPKMWILPVVPGDHKVTTGGAISNNVHGKSSWRYGNFGSHIYRMRVMLADGREVTASSTENRDLFEGLISGIGGLGVIVEAELKLLKIPSAHILVETVTVDCIEKSLAVLNSSTEGWDLFLSWSDMFPRGEHLGRGFVERARWDPPAEGCTPEEVRESLYGKQKFLRLFPYRLVWRMLRPFWGRRFVRWLNGGLYWSGWFRSKFKAPRRMLVTDFLTIHKRLPDMRDVYKPHGYYEFQPLIARESGPRAVRELMEICQQYRCESLLCGIKLHKPDGFPLSYCGDGYSVGIDIHAAEISHLEAEAFAEAVVNHTMESGGRVFLAKDQWLAHHHMRKLFSRFDDYLDLKKRYDPGHLFETRQIARVIRPHLLAALAESVKTGSLP